MIKLLDSNNSDEEIIKNSPLNSYCLKAGLTAPPNIFELVQDQKVKSFYLMVCVILERGAPMTLEEIASRLSETNYFPSTGDWLLTLKKAWRGSEPVYYNSSEGKFGIDFSSPELPRMLYFKLHLISKYTNSPLLRGFSDTKKTIDRPISRAIVRFAHEKNKTIAALSILDLKERHIQTFMTSELQTAIDLLLNFEVLIGLNVRESLFQLNLEPDRWHLTDLNPPQKKKTINKSGKKLNITPELLISGTTGISRPLSDPKKNSQYLEEGSKTKLIRSLESDAKALFAFYSYGVLQNHVRLRWGFIDDNLMVEWALQGDKSYYDLIQEAVEKKANIEVVIGSAPGWSEPWSRAKTTQLVQDSYDGRYLLQIEDTRFGGTRILNRDEIQAMRVVEN